MQGNTQMSKAAMMSSIETVIPLCDLQGQCGDYDDAGEDAIGRAGEDERTAGKDCQRSDGLCVRD